jgi:PEGA domain
MRAELRFYLVAALFLMVSAVLSMVGQEKSNQAVEKGQVWVDVLPEEAYIWVDGKPMSHRSSFLNLPPGEHTITVYNYGYEPQSQKVTVVSKTYQAINAHLKPKGERVSGPWGRIQIEGVPGNSLVFLNGTTPEFFVGHADEMNNNFVAKQQLIVPVGKQQLYVVRRSTDQPIWSGSVDVKQDKRLIVYVKGKDKAKMVYKDWPQGEKIKSLKRFEAGTASATIAVAPVTAKLAADNTTIHCDQPAKLTWSSTNAAQTAVTANDQKLAEFSTGDLDVQPKKTTKYELRAAGPGGVVTQEATINVDNTVKTSLAPSTPEVRYSKVGDTVKEQGSATLNWTATNADSVEIDPIGRVSGNSGSETVQPSPTRTDLGPIDETLTYKITATNDCGGSDTSTASIHLTGSIEGEEVAQAAPPPELPHTASPLPLLAILGLTSLAGGVGRMIRNRC